MGEESVWPSFEPVRSRDAPKKNKPLYGLHAQTRRHGETGRFSATELE